MSDTLSAAQPRLKQPPKLTHGETRLLRLTVILLLAVGALGLIASFQSVSEAAARWGFQTPQILPIAIDLAIPGFTIANLLLIRVDMELAWVRAVPWALTAVTVYLNIQAGPTLPAKVGHGALPLVWVVCSEIAAHVYRVLIGAATGKRMERIRRARFLLSPLTTSAMWRRMVLWEETSYGNALTRERHRVLARAELRERYGRGWRWRAPIRERALLRLGELAPNDEREQVSVSVTSERERPVVESAERPSLSVNERPALTAPAQPSALTEPPDQTPAPSVSAPEQPSSDNMSATSERPSASPAERPTPARSPRSTVSALTDARSTIVRPLYTTLGRRPEWTEIRDALIQAGHESVSRPTAQRIRERVEKNHPELMALTPSVDERDTAQLSGTDD